MSTGYGKTSEMPSSYHFMEKAMRQKISGDGRGDGQNSYAANTRLPGFE